MDWLAHNSGFVAAAYIVSALCLAALITAIVVTDRKRARELKDKS